MKRELAYLLLLFSGYIKQYLMFFNLVSIDFTLVIGVLLMLILVYDYLLVMEEKLLQPEAFLGILLVLMFVAICLASITYTFSDSYYLTKILNFGVCVIAYLFPLLAKKFRTEQFIKYFLWLSLGIASTFLVVFPFSYHLTDFEIIREAYLVIGHLCGLALLVMLTLSKTKKTMTAIFILTLILSGARGPLIFTVVLSLLVLFSSKETLRQLAKPKVILLSSTIITASIFVIASNETLSMMAERSINRTMLLFSDDVGDSANVRIHHINDSLAFIEESPISGYGLGSYGKVTQGIDQRSYPHNSILEVWFELGLLGLFSFLMFNAYHLLWTLKKLDVAHFAVLLYLFTNSLKSASFAELKIMFGFYAVYLLASCFGQNHIYTTENLSYKGH